MRFPEKGAMFCLLVLSEIQPIMYLHERAIAWLDTWTGQVYYGVDGYERYEQ